MKNLFLLTLSIFIGFTVFGQMFEGKVIYANSYVSKNPKMTDLQWTTMMGSTQEYFIKGGEYKTISNGTFLQWQLYVNKDNKVYSKMSNSEKALWNDASFQDDQVLKTEFKEGATEVLGYKCDELILTCKTGVQKYYFNSTLSVDAKLFANHKYGNWYKYLYYANSLPLKTIIETPQYTMESVATHLSPMQLDSNTFEIPAGMFTDKSPY